MKGRGVCTLMLPPLLLLSLAVRSEAKVVLGQGPHTAVEGTSTSINCSVTEETFKGWFTPSNSRILTDRSERVHVQGQGSHYYLVINPVNRTDRGRYQCSGSKEKAYITLTVYYTPSVKLSESTTDTIFSSIKSTERREIKCVFDGNPVPTVSISKPMTKKVVVTGSGSASYEFSTTTPDDYGYYTCEGKNVAGTATHYVQVYQSGPPEPPSDVQVRLNCDRVDLSWAAPLSNRGGTVTAYRVELLQGGRPVDSESFDTDTTSHTFGSLERSAGYVVRLNARNSMGSGSWRTIAFNTTELCSPAQAPTMTNSLLVAVLVFGILLPGHWF